MHEFCLMVYSLLCTWEPGSEMDKLAKVSQLLSGQQGLEDFTWDAELGCESTQMPLSHTGPIIRWAVYPQGS